MYNSKDETNTITFILTEVTVESLTVADAKRENPIHTSIPETVSKIIERCDIFGDALP